MCWANLLPERSQLPRRIPSAPGSPSPLPVRVDLPESRCFLWVGPRSRWPRCTWPTSPWGQRVSVPPFGGRAILQFGQTTFDLCHQQLTILGGFLPVTPAKAEKLLGLFLFGLVSEQEVGPRQARPRGGPARRVRAATEGPAGVRGGGGPGQGLRSESTDPCWDTGAGGIR